MKSVTMNQTALKTEIFFAYMRNREINVDGVKAFVRGAAMSHEFELSFEIWNGTDYKSIVKYYFSKSQPELNSVEPSDIVEFIHQQFHAGLNKFTVALNAIPATVMKEESGSGQKNPSFNESLRYVKDMITEHKFTLEDLGVK